MRGNETSLSKYIDYKKKRGEVETCLLDMNMYCQNCGYKLQEGDKFCQNCGTKVECEKKPIQTNAKELLDGIEKNKIQEINEGKTKNNHVKVNINKKGKIIVAIVSVILLVVISIGLKPKEINFEVDELAAIISSESIQEYSGKSLIVHGYLLKDERLESLDKDTDTYTLVNSIEEVNKGNMSTVFFKYTDGFSDDIGTGSEIKIKCEIDQNNSPILLCKSVEIQNKESLHYTDFDTVFSNLNYYEGKRVILSGRMYKNFEYSRTTILDFDLEEGMLINGLSEEEIAKCFNKGSNVILTGEIAVDTEIVTINVEKIEQNEITKDLSYNYEDAITISDVYNYYWESGSIVTIVGDYVEYGSFSIPYSIHDHNTGQFVVLNPSYGQIDLSKYFTSGEKCVITGYLYETGTGYRLDIIGIG